MTHDASFRDQSQPLVKYNALKAYLHELGSCAVAFSGGVDSAFLLQTAHDVLGDRAVAITASSCFFPEHELDEAKAFCKSEGIQHIIFTAPVLDIEGITHNPKNRCYLCKHNLFGRIIDLASEMGIEHVIEGSNMDDRGDYRPGLKAIKELSIKSPLMHAGLDKNEIRALSKEIGLPTWNKPSLACLASRFPYGSTITKEKLLRVDRAEQYLTSLGFRQVRVRIHDDMARIELPPHEIPLLTQNETRENVTLKLKEFGFLYVSVDLTGYRTGSMNEALPTLRDSDSH